MLITNVHIFKTNRYFIERQLLTSLLKILARYREVLMGMTKKVLQLNFEKDFDFLIVGLLSAYRDFRLCFELNEAMKINFLRNKDVYVPAGKPGSSTRHSYFSCTGRDHEKYHVISNRDKEGTGYFIPEMKNIDYFLIVSEVAMSYDISKLIKLVRGIEIVSGAYDIQPSQMKSAEAFLLFLEG